MDRTIVGFRCETCSSTISRFQIEVQPPDVVVLEASCEPCKVRYVFETKFDDLRAIGEGSEVHLFSPSAERVM